MPLVVPLLLFLLTTTIAQTTNMTKIKIGVYHPELFVAPALWALDYPKYPLEGFELESLYSDTNCDESTALLAFNRDIIANPDMAAVFGAFCSGPSSEIAYLGKYYNMTQISGTSTNPSLSDRTNFPYFLRTVAPDNDQAVIWLAACKLFHWNEVVLLFARQSVFSDVVGVFTDLALQHNITIVSARDFPADVGYNPTNELQTLQATGVKVILLMSYSWDAQTVFRAAAQLGMIGPPYTYLAGNGAVLSDVQLVDYWQLPPGLAESDAGPEYIKNNESLAMYPIWTQGLLGTVPYFPNNSNPRLELFREQNPDFIWNSYVPFQIDAMDMLIRGIRYMFFGRNPPWNGAIDGIFRDEVYHYLTTVPYDGLTGVVFIDSHGNRNQSHSLIFMKDGRFETAGKFSIKHDLSASYTKFQDVIFPGNTTKIPTSRLPIRFSYVDISLQVTFTILAGVNVIILSIFFFLTLVYFNHQRIRAATPAFMVLISFSTLLATSIVFVIAVYPTNATCIIPHWFGHVAFFICFSCLFFKTLRVWYIFFSRIGKEIVTIKNHQLLMFALVPVVGVMIYLALFTALDPPHLAFKSDPSDSTLLNAYCQFNNNWIIALYVVEAVWLIITMILGFQIRKIDLLRFNESTHITISVFALFFIGIVLVPSVHWLSSTTDTLFVLESVCILLSTLTVTLSLFLPKFKAIFQGKNDTDSPRPPMVVGLPPCDSTLKTKTPPPSADDVICAAMTDQTTDSSVRNPSPKE